jgi:hypothetical protein
VNSFLEKAVISIFVIAMIMLLFQTAEIFINIPESDYKKNTISLLIPLIGAFIIGISMEIIKYWLTKTSESNKRKSDIIADVTQNAVSISMQLYEEKNVVMVNNWEQYKTNLNKIFQLVVSTGSAECIEILNPLVECLQSKNETINSVQLKNSLSEIIISLRKNFGYINTEKSKKTIKMMML